MQLLKGKNFIRIVDLSLIDAFVILCELKSKKLEGIFVLEEGIRGKGEVEEEGLRTCLLDKIAIEVFGFIDDLFFV
jgi:hypothetical protein